MNKLVFIAIVSAASTAIAHPHVTSGPTFAKTSGQLVTFGISHGCSSKDTVSVKIDIPANITSIRPLYGPDGFGMARVTKNGSQVTSATWEKTGFNPENDTAYLEFVLRLRVEDVPFTKIRFNVTQICRDGSGDTAPVLWDGLDDTMGREAPYFYVVPAHVAGWNQVTVPVAVSQDDIPHYFGDAQIVWRGTEAYSPNMAVNTLITMTPGVTALAGGLSAGDVLWVKY